MKKVISLIFSILLVGVLVGCQPASTSQPTLTPTPLQEFRPTETAPAEPLSTPTSLPLSGLQDAPKALLYVQAEGEFVEPDDQALPHPAGSGSGFIIHPSGLALTDYHAVAGAESIQVLLGGDPQRAYQAELLGASLCDDLALIQLQGEGFPYLSWSPTRLERGVNLYIAGYPQPGEAVLLSKGMLTSLETQDLPWASLPSALVYDALAAPGALGSALIDLNGAVLGMHSGELSGQRRSIGIPAASLQAFVEQVISQGAPQDWGLNAQTSTLNDSGLQGVYLSAVAGASPADEIGLAPGDLITQLGAEGLPLGDTLRAFCEIQRSHSADEPLAMQVVRLDGERVFEGELFGEPLAATGLRIMATPSVAAGSSGTTVVNPLAEKSGEFYMYSEFDRPDEWYSFALPESQDYEAAIRSGALYLQVNPVKTSVYALYPLPLSGADVELRSLVSTIAGPNRNNISLICRASEVGWYEFSMNSGGYWFIWRFADGEYEMLNSGGSHKINLQKAQNEISAVCAGESLKFYVNNSLMGTAVDDTFTEGGQVGVSVSTFDIPGAGVEFYWISAMVP